MPSVFAFLKNPKALELPVLLFGTKEKHANSWPAAKTITTFG